MSGLTGDVLRLLGEVVGLGLAVGAIAVFMRRRHKGAWEVRSTIAAALAALVFALALLSVSSAGSVLNQARRDAVSPRVGLNRCLLESLIGAPPVLSRLPFIDWLKTQLPRHAVYRLSPYNGLPDVWCVTLDLLPALPAGPGGVPRWTITLGREPSDLRARVARHDPTVRVFGPGYVLAHDPPR